MKHFKLSEFACKCGCGRYVNKMNEEFLNKLDAARDRSVLKWVITSGYRCPSYNLSVGGKPHSAHLTGQAADIYAGNSYARFIIVDALLAEGFKRIGIGPDFVHADTADNLPYPVIWTYYS